jgi:hypothetical protein
LQCRVSVFETLRFFCAANFCHGNNNNHARIIQIKSRRLSEQRESVLRFGSGVSSIGVLVAEDEVHSACAVTRADGLANLQELPILRQFPLSFTRISPPLWPESRFPTREA